MLSALLLGVGAVVELEGGSCFGSSDPGFPGFTGQDEPPHLYLLHNLGGLVKPGVSVVVVVTVVDEVALDGLKLQSPVTVVHAEVVHPLAARSTL